MKTIWQKYKIWLLIVMFYAAYLAVKSLKVLKNIDIRKINLTQFISHRLVRGEFKRFYRYREIMLDGCKSD